MPKKTFSNNTSQTELDELNQGNQKNVSFYFSPSQLQQHNASKNHEAKFARFDEQFDLESSDEEDDLSTILSEESDESSSITSSDFEVESWDDLVVYGEKLNNALSDQNVASDRFNHARKFEAVKKNIEDIIRVPAAKNSQNQQQRATLFTMRADLNNELNSINNAILTFIKAHQISNTTPTPGNKFFDTTSASRLVHTISEMRFRLDQIVPQPEHVSSQEKLLTQIRNISRAIYTTKGALLSEIETIKQINPSESNLINQHFNSITKDMSYKEIELATDLYNEFKTEANVEQSSQHNSEMHIQRAELYARRSNLNDYLKDIKSTINQFIEAHKNSQHADKTENKFFNSAIAQRLINTMQSVQNSLDKIVPQKNMSEAHKLNSQIINIARGILTITGAVLTEASSLLEMHVSDTNAEMNENFAQLIADMEPTEKVLALDLYDQFKLQSTLDESIVHMSTAKSNKSDALYKERAQLVSALKSFQKELTQLPNDYEAQKKSDAANNLNRFFGTGQKGEDHRLDAITRIQATAGMVQNKLDEINPSQADMKPEEKLRSQIQNLKQGIQAIKGSVINEFDNIQGSIFGSERSALYKVLNKNYGLTEIKSVEKDQALRAFEALDKVEPEIEHASSLSA